jgi:rRNA processing protein Gar1
MKKIGKVGLITRSGKILVHSDGPIKLGTIAVNRQINKVGKVVDVIGPTTAPKIVISPTNAQASVRPEEELYSMTKKKSHRHKKKDYRKRRSHRS